MDPESWRQHPSQAILLSHDSDTLDPLCKRYLEAEEIVLDILEDSTLPHNEDVSIALVDGSPW